jgi:hypothetical protein
MFTKAELNELYDIVAGNGRWAIVGSGLRTYPDSDEWKQIRLHQGCLELEKQDRIQRKIDEPDYVLWVVKTDTEKPARRLGPSETKG